MEPSVKMMLFFSIGGVIAFLPLMFLKKERMTVKNLVLALSVFVCISVFFSAVVAVGGTCGFLETLLMKGSQCNNLPFANSRAVPVFNTMAFVLFVLIFIAIVRDITYKLIGKNGKAL